MPDQKPQPKTEIKPQLKLEPKPSPNKEEIPTQKLGQSPTQRLGQSPTQRLGQVKHPKKIRQRIADLKELAIAIDSFEDLFSDFDPREYDKRDLSDDFLTEVQKRYRETGKGRYEVIFHAPKTIRNEKVENVVIQRIKQHFRNNAKQNQKGVSALRFRGSLYISFGVILLTVLTLLAYGKILSDFQIELLGVIFLPLGWFGIWEGFSKIVDIPYMLSSELELNQKLARANYQFKFFE